MRVAVLAIVAVPVLIGLGAVAWYLEAGLVTLWSLLLPRWLVWCIMAALNVAIIGGVAGAMASRQRLTRL